MELLLFELLEAYSRVFIVIDALDECQASAHKNSTSSSGRRPRYREEVLDFIGTLASRSTFCAKVLVTSRREEDIMDAFYRRPVIEIDAAQVNVDIRTYLHDEIELRIKKRTLKLGNPEVKDRIFYTLVSRAQGMFLWVTLQLDWICQQRGDDDILSELERLPRDLCETYDRILERLNQQPPKLREVARRVIMWVLYAFRPLNMRELREAISIESSMKSCRDLKSKTREKQMIINCIGALLTPLYSSYDTVRLIHTSVYEYLTSASKDRNHSNISDFFIDKELAHTQIASSCMDFLLLEGLQGCWSGDSIEMLVYSTSFFDKHITCLDRLPQEIFSKIDRLLDSSEDRLSIILEARYRRTSDKPTEGSNATTFICATDLFHILQSHSPDSHWMKLKPLRNSFHLAAGNGTVAAMQILLELGQGIDDRNDENVTPLYYSAMFGHRAATKWLIEHGAFVDSHDVDYGTALTAAAENGHLAVVELLLKHNADVNLQGGYYGTALQAASANGELAIVELLLKHNADVNLQGGYYGTALQAASERGYLAIVELLLNHGANITPGSLEEAYGKFCHEDTVASLLLTRGAQITAIALENSKKNGWESR